MVLVMRAMMALGMLAMTSGLILMRSKRGPSNAWIQECKLACFRLQDTTHSPRPPRALLAHSADGPNS